MIRKKWVITFIGTIIGGVLGFLYWKNVGCESGTCAITSSPTNSSLYGMLMGGLLFNSIEDYIKPKKENDSRNNSSSELKM